MSTYTPDRWIVVKLTKRDTGETINKVLAGWYGGFAGADSWKLNSGITKVDERNDRFEFHGSSGLSSLTANMLEYWRKNSANIDFEILEEYDVRSNCE
jgi:hypothetical protein